MQCGHGDGTGTTGENPLPRPHSLLVEGMPVERQLKGPHLARTPVVADVAGLGGAIAGLIAGLVMVIISPFLSLMTGIGMWEPVKLIATAVYSPTILDTPGFMLGPVVVGALIHFVVSTVLGIIFGLIFNRVLHLPTAFGVPIQVGLVYGVLIWTFVYFLVLPFINPTLRASYQTPFIAQHLVYGVVLGIAYMFVRQLPYRYQDSR